MAASSKEISAFENSIQGQKNTSNTKLSHFSYKSFLDCLFRVLADLRSIYISK